GNTGEDLSLTNLSTKRQRIAELARTKRGVALSALHHLDLEWMQEAYRLTSKDGTPGIDGVTADEYATNLDANHIRPPGSHQVGSLPSAAGAQGLYSEDGWLVAAARHPDLRR